MAASRKSSDRERNSAKSASRSNTGGRSRKAAPGPKDPKRSSNPLTHIRFGSAGSGGAEFEPISTNKPKKPKKL